MTITVDIKPEVEAELAAQAAAHGMDVPAYAAVLLEEASLRTEKQSAKKTLSEFLMDSPLAGSGIDLERDRDQGRNVEL